MTKISKLDSLEKLIAIQTNNRTRFSQTKDVEEYLEASEKLEDDLVTVEDAYMSGTCRWFYEKEEYGKWSALASNNPNILRVTGRRAADKSGLAGYVIGQLQKAEASCSYFFFEHGDRSKSRLSGCLRFPAF